MRKHAVWVAMFLGLATLALAGGLEWLERALMELRFRAAQRDAGQRLVLVEIDETSLRRLDTWPWPRARHAALLDRLIAAGAETVAFDIDFSARTQPADDEAFAAALARAPGRAVLAVFNPKGRAGAPALRETRPLAMFARHAALASVTVIPDSDSRVRRIDTTRPLADGPLPAMPVLLGASGRPVPASFYIDYGIRAETIPRISYADALEGGFPPGFFAGRTALVAATAVQLGDNLSTPVHVIASGGEVMALAAESLRQDRALVRTGSVPALLLAFALTAWFAPRLGNWHVTHSFGAVTVLSILALGASVAVQAIVPVCPDSAPALIAPWLALVNGLIQRIERQARGLFRQRLQMQQNALVMREIVANSFDALIVFDHDGRVTLHNRAAGAMFGATGDELRGLDAKALVRVSTNGAGRSLGDLLGADDLPPGLLEGVVVDRGGKEIPVELSLRRVSVEPVASRFDRGGARRVFHFLTARDITARRGAEAVRERALKEAIAANRAKSQFLATVSHELRTPLNAILGFSEILKGHMLGPLGHANYLEYAQDIHGSGRHLLEVINDILDVTRVELGEVKVEAVPINLADCVQSTERLVADRAARKQLALQRLIPADLPALVADPRLVKQILINLLSNAIKFTPDRGRVTVAATCGADGGITLSVCDTGIGIPKDAIARLGTPFSQVDQSHARSTEGLGLGLSIVAGLMKLHGGTFAVESEFGAGTTVFCRFPPERTGAPNRAAA
jgi:PAS domain S-box-containing protein